MVVRVGFDIGGTFTDFVLEDEADSRLYFAKIPSTVEDVSRAVIAGLRVLLENKRLKYSDIMQLHHATTVATNAILERKGAHTALLTTKGFRDVILIGRQKRYDPFDLYMRKPTPLIRRKDIYEIEERTLPDGEIETEVCSEMVKTTLERLKADGVESIAVSMLHAYANPNNERVIAQLIRSTVEIPISVSSEVSPKIREYERTSTTVANAYVQPIMSKYVNQLRSGLCREGVNCDLHIMQSNGGLVTPGIAAEFPIRVVESGPAAGVLMCRHVAADEGFLNALSFDMGGTTAKIGAIDFGEPAVTTKFEIDAIHYRPHSGLPLNIAAIELLEIGAGGGSIAGTDGHTLSVGPESAGASPGPICYQKGGKEPTLTDANLVLGYLDPQYFNGGAMPLDLEAAGRGIFDRIGRPLGLGLVEAAWGVHAFANSNMERATRVVSVERGRDPRKYCLVAFGGAGPTHATRIARALAIPTVIVPLGAGVGSAVGLLRADVRVDASQTHLLTLQEQTGVEIKSIYKTLQTMIDRDVSKLGPIEGATWIRYAHMRYAGQGFEIRVMLPSDLADPNYVALAKEAFTKTYEREFGYSDPNGVIEAVDWSLVIIVPKTRQNMGRPMGVPIHSGSKVRPLRKAYFPEAGGMVACEVISRAAMRGAIKGPAIIEDPETSVLVGPKDTATLSPRGHIIISIARSGLL